jgi:hypothetical protein
MQALTDVVPNVKRIPLSALTASIARTVYRVGQIGGIAGQKNDEEWQEWVRKEPANMYQNISEIHFED